MRIRGVKGSSEKQNSFINICIIRELLVTLLNIILNVFTLGPSNPCWQAGLNPVVNYERL